ncbi:hypothetical protein IWQ56_006666, partial [Coemansia nantahalensis]
GGGGGGGGGHGSSGGHGGSGGHGSSGGGGKGSGSGTSTGIRGGGGSGSKGSGSFGDRPPSYASLYPSRSGFDAGGKPVGGGDGAHRYSPPPSYYAGANYASANRGQTVSPNSFSSNAPAIYYAATHRDRYPGAWGYGFYPLYPYPFWAYGAGVWYGATYHTPTVYRPTYTLQSEFRNITVVDATSHPLIGDANLFNNTYNSTFTDYNNGSIQIGPCGNASSETLGVAGSDCDFIVLDIKGGLVLRGNAVARVVNETTFFDLRLGANTTALRTMTITSTLKKTRGGIVAGIVLGVIGFVALSIVALVLLCRCKAKRKLRA